MDTEELLSAYATLVLEVGIGLRAGQPLFVRCPVDAAPLAREVTRAAYRAGAPWVDVAYEDPYLRAARAAGAPRERLGASHARAVARLSDAGAAGLLAITGASYASLFEGIDPARVGATRQHAVDRTWIDAVSNGRAPWTIVGFPTDAWAAEASDGDVARLWEACAHALRLDTDDPTGAWHERFDALDARARSLTEHRFDALRYRGPGTELEVGLIDGVRWRSARTHTQAGQQHVANLPSEEVFTNPHRSRAEGTVASSMPLALRGGGIVEGLRLRFSGGEIVEADADRGAELLRAEIALDDGARRLGELALVDASSRIVDTGLIFRNTLYDENAASHIAWGNGVDPAAGGPDEVNASQTHVDFMVGSVDLEVDGVHADGSAVPLLRGGDWQLDD